MIQEACEASRFKCMPKGTSEFYVTIQILLPTACGITLPVLMLDIIYFCLFPSFLNSSPELLKLITEMSTVEAVEAPGPCHLSSEHSF
jgi:hypothetical protein